MSTDDRKPGADLPGSAPHGAEGLDEQLSAWLDGGLDDDGNAKMTDLAARNEDVARRAERLRRMDELVRAAVPEEDTVPAKLLARLGLAPQATDSAPQVADSVGGPAAEVIDLASARAAREARVAAARPARFFGAKFFGLGRMAAQLLLVIGLGLGGLLAWNTGRDAASPERPAEYRVLGDSSRAAPPANALVRFAPDVDAAAASRLARDAGASLVSAPSAAGTARLAIEPGRRAVVLARLRDTPGVIMAEPLDGGAQ